MFAISSNKLVPALVALIALTLSCQAVNLDLVKEAVEIPSTFQYEKAGGVLAQAGQAHASAAPGSIDLSVNVTSIQNIMQTFVPILAYFSLQN
mmetsp:Transcript_5416/g.9111  ORF Transcript_5416/g.9111 Transcript_5416/m.9111 type:complete len:93 (+) Transcript_5416:20-298(+)